MSSDQTKCEMTISVILQAKIQSTCGDQNPALKQYHFIYS